MILCCFVNVCVGFMKIVCDMLCVVVLDSEWML